MAQGKPTKTLGSMLILGLFLVGNAMWNLFIRPTDLDKFTATATDGVIVDIKSRESDDSTYYRPIISFTDSDHLSHETPSVVEYNRRPSKGTQVTVRFDPFRPEDGCIIQGDEGLFRRKVFGYYVSLVGGIVVIALDVVFYRKDRSIF